VYIRSGRPKAPLVFHEEPNFEFGKAARVRDGEDVTVIANGLMVAAGVVAHDRLKQQGINVRVVDMATVKPLDDAEVAAAARDTGAIVVAEEHLIHGGLGARVAQSVVRQQPVPMEFVGLDDQYAESGDPEALMKKYGLTANEIVAAVERVLQRKSADSNRREM
jgi:transketolase